MKWPFLKTTCELALSQTLVNKKIVKVDQFKLYEEWYNDILIVQSKFLSSWYGFNPTHYNPGLKEVEYINCKKES